MGWAARDWCILGGRGIGAVGLSVRRSRHWAGGVDSLGWQGLIAQIGQLGIGSFTEGCWIGAVDPVALLGHVGIGPVAWIRWVGGD